MKSSICTPSFIFFFLTFISNSLFSQPIELTYPELIGQTIENHKIPISSEFEFTLNYYQALMQEKNIVKSEFKTQPINPYKEIIGKIFDPKESMTKGVLPNHPGLPLGHNIITPETSSSNSLHFRSNPCRLDSTYMFMSWSNPDEPFQKKYYYYDDNDKLIQTVFSYSNPFLQTLYEYDTEGRLKTELHQIWKGQDWENLSLIEYGYVNVNSFPKVIYYSFWNIESNMWQTWKRENLQLNYQNIPGIKTIYYIGDSDSFILSSRVLFSYNTSLMIQEAVYQRRCFIGAPSSWINASKTSYTYEVSGNLYEEITSNWRIDHWSDLEQTIHYYDDSGNLTSEEEFGVTHAGVPSWQNWQRDLIVSKFVNSTISTSQWGEQNWVVSSMADSIFSNNGKLEEILITSNQCPDNLIPHLRITFEYNPNGQLQERVQFWKDFNNGEWIPKSKKEFTFNSLGQLKTESTLHRQPNSNFWTFSSQIKFAYDPQSLLIEKVSSHSFNGNWLNDKLETFTYDSLSMLSEEIHFYWLYSTESWQPLKKFDYSYNQNNQLIEKTGSRWTLDSIWQWKPGYLRYVYEYKKFGLLKLEKLFLWNIAANTWKPTYRYNYYHDYPSGKLIEKITEIYRRSEVAWIQWSTKEHFCSGFSTATEFTSLDNINCIYPNPFKQGSSISCENIGVVNPATLSVYDIMGRLHLKQQFTRETRIEKQLSAGSYFLIISDDKGNYFRDKIIIH